MAYKINANTIINNSRCLTHFGYEVTNLGNISGDTYLNYSNSQYFSATVVGNTNISITGGNYSTAGLFLVLRLVNGGSATINWGIPTVSYPAFSWEANTAPTLTSSGTDVLIFFTREGDTAYSPLVRGYVAMKDVK